MRSLEEERRILNLFKKADTLEYNNEKYRVISADKPTYNQGEGKTDIYILLKNNAKEVPLKISSKQSNADFLENKLSAKRAETIFGENWSEIITSSALQLKELFEQRQIYFPTSKGRVEAGSYTMGWRVDIVNKKSGKLSCPIILTLEQKKEIFLGANLPTEKRNVKVGNILIQDAGVANKILLNSECYDSAQAILNALIEIEDYSPNCFFAFKAVNYRSLTDEIDGNRSLAVWINWESDAHEPVFTSPLIYGSKNDILKTFKKVF